MIVLSENLIDLTALYSSSSSLRWMSHVVMWHIVWHHEKPISSASAMVWTPIDATFTRRWNRSDTSHWPPVLPLTIVIVEIPYELALRMEPLDWEWDASFVHIMHCLIKVPLIFWRPVLLRYILIPHKSDPIQIGQFVSIIQYWYQYPEPLNSPLKFAQQFLGILVTLSGQVFQLEAKLTIFGDIVVCIIFLDCQAPCAVVANYGNFLQSILRSRIFGDWDIVQYWAQYFFVSRKYCPTNCECPVG